MPKRREETPSDTDDAIDDNLALSDDDENAVAQWVDEDELDGLVDSEEDEFAEERDEEDGVESMKRNLSSLPFGTLAKAAKLVQSESSDSDSDEHAESDNEESSQPQEDPSKLASSSKTPTDRHKKVKRIDKHAPMEVSSKKPVTRRRQVIEVPKIDRRDPRFSSLSGTFSEETFTQSYSFITSIQQSEVAELRTSLSRARKLLASSPIHLREERAAEVTRLERALKRTESNVEHASRDKRKREALAEAKREEMKKREAGKGTWYMKDSEKRKVITEAKFKDLAKEGSGAVRKAIAKRQLKISQKEKRSRPDGKGRGGGRPFAGRTQDAGYPQAKRQKVAP